MSKSRDLCKKLKKKKATHSQYSVALFLYLVGLQLGLHSFSDDSRVHNRGICTDFFYGLDEGVLLQKKMQIPAI